MYGGLFLIHIISWSRIFAIWGLKHNSTQQRKLPCWRSSALFFSSSLNVKFSQWHHRFFWLPTTTFLSMTEHFPDHVGNLDWFYLFIYLFICRCGRCYMTTLIHSWELVSTQPPPVSCSIIVQREVFSYVHFHKSNFTRSLVCGSLVYTNSLIVCILSKPSYL